MRVIWVTREGSGGAEAGGVVYDRKMCAALGASHEITPWTAAKSSRPRQLAAAALHVAPPEIYGYGADADRLCAAAAAAGADVIVFAHEHLDRLAQRVRDRLGPGGPAFVSVRQNVTSDAMADILSDWGPIGALYAQLGRRQERDALCGPLFQSVVVLSSRDRRVLSAITGRDDIAIAMPGAPPPTPLADDARFEPGVVLLGTYDWFPKAWGLRRFLAEAPALAGQTVYADCADVTGAESAAGLDHERALRVGVITDRFTAGHKLKTAAYVMRNCIVATFADVVEDFAFADGAERFIRRVHHVRDIATLVQEMAAAPQDDLRAAFARFKAQVAETFRWDRQAEPIAAAIARAVSARKARAA